MERKFDIIVDSACDMPSEFLKENEIVCVRMGFTMDNEEYEGECGKSISTKEFYQKLREGAMPTTYQVTSELAKKYMEKSLQNGRDVLVIAFSSGLSGTAGSFEVAKKELSAVYPDRKMIVVDSLCSCMGEGMLLYYAIKKADTGATIEKTAAYTEDLKLHICHHFTVDDLFHLKRGGRVSAATAFVGSILKIKPIMHVSDEGKLVVIGKAMGRKKSLKQLVDNFMASRDMDENDPVFISHGDCPEDAEYLKNMIEERMPGVQIFIGEIGSVIGSHSGCGTIAIYNKGIAR